MTKSKILSVVVFLSAIFAAPAFAEEGVIGPGSRYGLEPQPGPIYYGPGYYGPTYYHAYGFAPSGEYYPRSWLERSRPGGRSTARRSSAE